MKSDIKLAFVVKMNDMASYRLARRAGALEASWATSDFSNFRMCRTECGRILRPTRRTLRNLIEESRIC
jgi:hypothetical protein